MPGTSGRGFASMSPERQREIASKGGRAAHAKGTAHEFTPDEARNAGKKGGERVSQNRDHMAAIGRRGGERVSQNREHMASIGRKGGESVSRNREHMSEIGREGGQSRGGHRSSDMHPGELESRSGEIRHIPQQDTSSQASASM